MLQILPGKTTKLSDPSHRLSLTAITQYKLKENTYLFFNSSKGGFFIITSYTIHIITIFGELSIYQCQKWLLENFEGDSPWIVPRKFTFQFNYTICYDDCHLKGITICILQIGKEGGLSTCYRFYLEKQQLRGLSYDYHHLPVRLVKKGSPGSSRRKRDFFHIQT
jgi:hypothetical protein